MLIEFVNNVLIYFRFLFQGKEIKYILILIDKDKFLFKFGFSDCDGRFFSCFVVVGVDGGDGGCDGVVVRVIGGQGVSF